MSTDSRSFPKSIQAHTASTTPHTISKDGITNASSDQSLFRLQQLSRDLLGLNQAHAPSTTFHAIKRDDVLIDQSYSILKDSTTRLSRGSHSSEEGHVAHERRINDLVEARWIEDKDRKERMKQELRRARDAIKSYSANVPEAPLVSSSSSSSNRSSHRGSVVVERSDNLVAKLKAPRIKGEESPNQGSYSNVTAVSMDDTSQSGKRARPNPNNFRGESKATSHREVVSASVNDSSHDAYHVSSSMNYSPARSPTYRLALPSMNDHSPARYGSQLNAWRLLSEPGPITTQVISRFQIAGDDTQGQQHTLSKLDQSVELDAPRQNPLAYELSQTTHDTSPEVQEPRLCGIKCLDAEANLQQLSDKIKELELEVRRLRSSGPKPDGVAQHPIKVQVFHRLPADGVGAYLSSPSWQLHGGTRDLKATFFIPDPERYVERVGDVTYIIYNNYTLEHQREDLDERARSNVPLPEPQPSHYQIQLVSKEMVEEMGAFLDALPNCRLSFPGIDEVGLMDGPFTWWYHCRKSYDPATLEPGKARLVSHLIASIEQIEGRLYQRIGTQFSSGKVSHWSLQYLIKPGTVLVYEKGSIIRGCLATSCSLSSEQSSDTISLTVQTRSIAFDGAFYEKLHTYTIKVPKEGEVEIASLEVYPLEHAEPGQRERLFRRGSTFWRCRKERLVSCFDHKSSQDGERFMVDFKTYKELHPNNSYIRPFTIDGRDHEKPRLPVDDCDPDEPEIFLFPAVIPGFNFRRKKWGTLGRFENLLDLQLITEILEEIEVDNIRDVVWNDKAFSHLVADEDMKDLIEALVSKQMQAEVSTDLIKNKGNGLIMLLHGSPGTGKTFTAESVAELARKPLYPVTCGDIGTEPEKVENYLNLIFSLGKKWNCVMLLDEAEVFLEQRTLQDLRRNALVSVFLRALEYYDGILILTTNRVGTFDEAFKSRIQISIPYKRLDTAQRKQIWRNFLRRLEQLEQHESIDFDDIDAHLDDLAAYTMNGRQIRNAMTTARQLAEFKKKKMNFASLKKTIGVSEKFDKYLADVREGDVREFLQHGKDGQRSDDLVARENELR